MIVLFDLNWRLEEVRVRTFHELADRQMEVVCIHSPDTAAVASFFTSPRFSCFSASTSAGMPRSSDDRTLEVALS